MTLRTGLTIAWYASMFTGAACLVYLLFALGHEDYMPLTLNAIVAAIAALSGITLAMLQWIGLPPEPEQDSKESKKKPM